MFRRTECIVFECLRLADLSIEKPTNSFWIVNTQCLIWQVGARAILARFGPSTCTSARRLSAQPARTRAHRKPRTVPPLSLRRRPQPVCARRLCTLTAQPRPVAIFTIGLLYIDCECACYRKTAKEMALSKWVNLLVYCTREARPTAFLSTTFSLGGVFPADGAVCCALSDIALNVVQYFSLFLNYLL